MVENREFDSFGFIVTTVSIDQVAAAEPFKSPQPSRFSGEWVARTDRYRPIAGCPMGDGPIATILSPTLQAPTSQWPTTRVSQAAERWL